MPPTTPCWPPCRRLPNSSVVCTCALQGDLPRSWRRRCQPLACDLTLTPYHGQPLHDANEVYRSQAKSGTTHFHAYATAYVVKKGQRFTVALIWVKKGQALKDVLWELLRQAGRGRACGRVTCCWTRASAPWRSSATCNCATVG